MKIIAIIAGTCILFCINAYSQNLKKINAAETDSIKVHIAGKFAGDFLTKLKNGSFNELHSEATDALKNQLTEEKQKAVYQQLKEQFGDFKSLIYAETWIQSGNTVFLIYRFKGDFEKSSDKLEIRVVLDKSDKISGFWIKPWSDVLN